MIYVGLNVDNEKKEEKNQYFLKNKIKNAIKALLIKIDYKYQMPWDKKIYNTHKDMLGDKQCKELMNDFITKIVVITLIAFIMMIISLFIIPKKHVEKSNIEITNNKIELKDYDELNKFSNVDIKFSSGDVTVNKEYNLKVPYKEMTNEKAVDLVLSNIDENLIKDKNESLLNIKEDLNLVKKNEFGVNIEWMTNSKRIDLKTGEVNLPAKDEANRKIKLEVVASKGKVKKIKTFNVRLAELDKSISELEVEKSIKDFENKLKTEDFYSIKDNQVKLITKIGNTKLEWNTKDKVKYEKDIRVILILIIIFILALSYYNEYKQIDKKEIERTKNIELKFPYFVEQLLLLIGAGFTSISAWDYISQNRSVNDYLTKEVKIANTQLKSGLYHVTVLNNFAKRTNSIAIKKFVNNFIFNMKRGDSKLTEFLREELKNSLIQRKNILKIRAEENSIKMILPLMLIFLAVLIIIAYPAILAINF